MDPGSQSTLGTNEDAPGQEEEDAGPVLATMTLTPDNAEAKLAFNEVAEWLNKQHARDEAQTHASKFMWVASQQTSDSEVTRLLRGFVATDSSSSASPPASPSQSQTNLLDEAEADPEAEPGTEIWTGLYHITLSEPPRQPLRGWVSGSAKIDGNLNDLVLCMPSSASFSRHKVRRHQAVFQIHSTGRMSIQTMSDRSDTYINGNRILRTPHVLNEPASIVTFGSLRYRLEYSHFAQTEAYKAHLQTYLQETLGSTADPQLLSLTPTPSDLTAIKIGQWKVTTGTVGSGAMGRVSIAMNDAGKVVALKRVSVGRQRSSIRTLQRKLETLTRLVKENNEHRLLQLLEVITDDAWGANPAADVWFVLEPAVADTLASLAVRGIFSAGHDRFNIIARVLVDVLEAVAFLHRHSWFHSDLKPENIGIRRWGRNAQSVVLLDLDGAQACPPAGQRIPPSPGTGGTVGYLSPEREMTGYNETSDVWSVGVMALWMIHGRQPWRTSVNPWRPGPQYAREQPHFLGRYKEAIDSTEELGNRGLRHAVLGMIRHPYAEQSNQRRPRFSASEALRYLSGDDSQTAKRAKRE
ncbi:kinase-like domain-containing protein [Stachybotrys elegans]|uniref:Kinase-like domain-containing protein n=1 Tax=Stachybotrys elegans TaxID=80388 RepID=A0A8K0SG68_9HYPO|nr:kinase-like domain-containing protein [Stachybotrys elegans]